jgi:cytochrome P450
MPRLVVLDPVLIGDVYGRLNNMYTKPGFMKDILSTLLGKGLVTSEGELWKQQRHVINPAFTFSNIEKMIPLMVDCTRRTLDQWSTKCKQSGSFELSIHEEMSSVTLDIIGGAAFGISFASSSELKTTFYRSLAGMLDMIERRFMNLTGMLPVIKHLPIASKRFIDNTCVQLKSLVDQFIADRKCGRTHPQCCDVDLLQLLLDARYDDGSSMDVKQVRDEAMTFVLAGHETTSSLLTWLLYQTSIQPEIWEQCKAEVDNELQGQLPDADNVKRLDLIDSVLHETLRFWPPVPMTSRDACADHTIGGHDGAPELKIAKGTTITVLAKYSHS